MGSCHKIEKIQKHPQSNFHSQCQYQNALREKVQQVNINEQTAPEPDGIKSLFKNMVEYPGNIYKGYGIKRMKAYKCSLNIKDLNHLRDEFWYSMKANKPEEWTIMHQACVFDHIKAEIYLANNNFRTLNGCINACVDEYNNIYHVPNFCINDPYFEKEIRPIDDTMTHDDVIEITIRDLYLAKNISIKVNIGITGIELKQLYAKAIDFNLDVNKSKLIFGGCLIQNNEFLYQHNIKDGFTLQIMTIKEEDKDEEKVI